MHGKHVAFYYDDRDHDHEAEPVASATETATTIVSGGADVNAQGGKLGGALQAAILVISLLLKRALQRRSCSCTR